MAAVLVSPRRFEVRELPVPGCGPDEVLIRVDRCGICGTDIHMFNGHYAMERLPIVPGHEFTGTISRVGDRAGRFALGQRVVADINIGCGACYYCRRNEVLNCAEVRQVGISRDGAFAEYVAIPDRLVIPAPADAAPATLALTEPIACVVRAARKAKVRFGQSVVVLGAGPIGNLHIQMMRLVGAAPIIVVELSGERARLAMQAGADAVVSDPSQVKDTVLKMTGGRGADIVIESVGLPQLYAQAFDLIRPGGHVAAFGITGPGDSIPLALLDTVLKENSVKGSVAGMGEDMHDALTLLLHGRFDVAPFVNTTYQLAAIQEAFETLKDRPGALKTQIAI
ncbi:zinc-dependent alcohol dehydrogenase [Mesorhizobium shangrilense]